MYQNILKLRENSETANFRKLEMDIQKLELDFRKLYCKFQKL